MSALHRSITMSTLNTQHLIPKLEEDRQNWVNYKDRLNMTLSTSGHVIHLTSDSIRRAIAINDMDANERQKRGKSHVQLSNSLQPL